MTARTGSPRHHESWPLGHLAIIAVALIVVWAAIGFYLWSERHAAMDRAAEDTANLARAFAESTIRTFENVDRALDAAADEYDEEGANLDLKAWANSHAKMKDLQFDIAVVAPDGRVILATGGPAAHDPNLTDPGFLRAQAQSATDGFALSAPIRSQNGDRQTIVATRRITGPGGVFAGSITGFLNAEDLDRFYDTMAIGHGAIALIDRQGIVLARVPNGRETVGRPLPSDTFATMLSGPAAGTFSAVSRFDNERRLFSYRRLPVYGLLLAVGLSDTDILSQYRFNSIVTIAAGFVVSAGILAAGAIMVRQRRRLLRSNEQIAVTLENMTQGILMVESDGSIGFINGRAIELLGIPQALLDSRPSFRQLIEWQIEAGDFGPPSAYPEGLRQTLQAGGLTTTEDAYERTRPNGTVLEIATRPMQGGRAVRTYTDITERKRTEAALADARDTAEASGRARMEFLAMMSHEIRTPMNSIIGFASLLMDMPLPPTVQQYVRIIRQSGNHLLQLINDILDLSKLDAGKLQLEDEAFDLREELAQTIDLLIGQAQEKRLALSIDVASNVPQRVHGDPGRLRQILINLIGNGLKFTSVGSVTVQVGVLTDPPHARRLAFRVKDTGIGIPPEKTSLLFNHFAQIGDGIARQYGGTGLGLAICKRLVEQMGGEIGVESEPGRGSTFFFDVPLRPAAEATVEPVAASALRILLADDNNTNRMVIARMLERLGHLVDMVGNGLEAVEGVRTRPYDLVVLDIAMPKMDGLAATEAIRDMTGRRGRVPIVGLTANVAESVEEECYRVGMNAFITKPVTPERLDQAIRHAIIGASTAATPGD